VSGWTLITGAGRGIGRAIALRLARDGRPVFLASRSAGPLAETHAACAAHAPVKSRVVDVRDEAAVRALGRALVDLDVSVVVNNAGVGRWQPAEETSLESWNEQLETNLRGAFLVLRETLPSLRARGGGLYVNLASDSSLVGKTGRAAYNASKFGLVGLTLALRAEAHEAGVHACVVYAGRTDTHFRGMKPGDRPRALTADDVAEVVAFVVRCHPRVVVSEIAVQPPDELVSGPRSLI
jgi:NAD(P)-dependent dehydrogenase (short-subunit alcohol dehydrogenase family)